MTCHCISQTSVLARLLSAFVVALALCPAKANDSVEFNRDIRPILAANCFECHGFDANHRQADLRLDIAEGAYAERDGVAAIRPGNLHDSELWNRVASDDPDLIMPPPDSKKQLKPEEIQLLQRWIEQGAGYQQHWAFEIPAAHEVPAASRPSWDSNPIDAFILQKLEQTGLQPQPPASREIQIRRVSFALTGLPPTIAERDEFLSDSSDTAYEAMVDRYLASPRFGEEQARHWLDVARYADTHGLHLDNEREMWAYRDWVVRAFNQNLPFDQFTTWQVAGDLLPNATTEQRVATGFQRCNVTTSEGGAIADEWLYRYAVDRASTTMQTWMGLTAGCAVCHDHKYDPITQRDFYSMYAFFYSAADPAMDGNVRNTPPFISVPSDEQSATLAAATHKESELRSQLEAALQTTVYSDPADHPADAEPSMQDVSDVIMDDVFLTGVRERNTSRDAARWVYAPPFGAKSGTRALELAFGSKYELTTEFTTVPVTVPANGRLDFWLRVDGHEVPTAFSVRLDDGAGTKRAVWGNADQVSAAGSTHDMGPLPKANVWVPVSIDLIQLGCQPAARIKSLVLTHSGGRVWIDGMILSGQLSPASDPLSSFQAWWTAMKGSAADGVPGELTAVLKAGPGKDVDANVRQRLLNFYQQTVQRISESPLSLLQHDWRQAVAQITIINDQIPGTMVFGELEKPRDAFVMLRGQYDKPGDAVKPGVPAAFSPLTTAEGQPLPQDHRATRLDLARWFLADDNPLTARVTVNRFWQQLFGTGLVQTSDDFGTRGDMPSHPELLDWLAVDFRQHGWDIKRLIRSIVLSSTFRQESLITSEAWQTDPQNRLLARGPRLRLDAEQLRDNALFVSGLIDLTMGGQGVRPYQPPGIWEPVGYENSNTRFYIQDHSAALYRRSVYCFLKRTAPPPFMSNFDGPNREQFCTRRERSNTPLQALQLMNDVQHFEAARALAERAIEEGGRSAESRIDWLFKTVLTREPDDAERSLVEQAWATQHSLFAADPPAADKVVTAGESTPKGVATAVETATWTMIANLILNLDETIMRN